MDHLKKSATGRLDTLWENIINNSEVFSYAINFYRYSKAKRMHLVHAMFNFATLPHVEISPEKVQALLKEHREKYLKPYGERITRLIELSRRNSIEPVFITQPMVFGDLKDPLTGADLAEAMAWGANGKVSSQILELYNDTVRTTAAQHHVLVIDLARELPKTTAYFYDTYHFTNAGCQQVAAIIAQHLEPWLAENYPKYTISQYAQPR
jgi:hypothetical protein